MGVDRRLVAPCLDDRETIGPVQLLQSLFAMSPSRWKLASRYLSRAVAGAIAVGSTST